MSQAPGGLHDVLNARQHHRILRLSFPDNDGPAAQLLANSLTARESLSRPFAYTVELLSDDPCIALKEVQGKLMCVQLVRGDGSMRYFTGHVFSFGLKRVDGGVSFYEARLGPWFNYLGLRKDNYLFHNTTTYQQSASIFGDYGSLADWDWRVGGDDKVMTDCCQFDETDSNFLERRWAASGILYWFEHGATGHRLILTDDSTGTAPIDGNPEIAFQRHGGAVEEDGIGEWSPSRHLMQASVSLASFDFKAPSPVVTSLPTLNKQGDVPQIESYEYTGAFGFQGGGRALAQLRMEEIEAAGKQFEGEGNCRAAQPGRWFRLTGHFDASDDGQDAQAREFLIVEVVHTASNNYHTSTAVAPHYQNRLVCIRKIVPWRAGRAFGSVETRIYGIQTATVVGPAGEEIHTDEYGRVRVQFHWDRAGTSDEKSSAWIRVATSWAGANFGMTSIPRVGTEVLVQFMDGNPDRPVITGMLPNARTMPPWPLPANKTQSGILTRSTPGGGYGNANALRFEDKAGQEQLWLHAERDQLTEVEHDEDKWVGNDRRKTVDHDETSLIKHDRTETVGHDERISIGHDRAEQVGHDERIAVGNDRSENVARNEKLAIGGHRTKAVRGHQKDRIGKNWSINVARMKTETIGMAYMQNVGMGRLDNVGLGYSLNVGLFMSTIVGMSQSTRVGKKISLSAGEELSISVGKSSLVMKADGSVKISGTTFNFEATGPVQISGKDVDIN